jgi:transcriptional regulator with XRE-family HTH domain
MPQPELGYRLREARAAAGLPLAELARRSGISRAAIRNIEEHASDPTTETVQRLARALEVSAAWLAFGDDVASTNSDAQARGS